MAVNCPTEIYGSSLANTICDFNSSSPSVTVENSGAVGGILMDNYQPNNSYIDLSNGGLVSNTSNIGIAITNSSSLSNGIINNGTISALTGIGVANNSVVNGGISNSGLISSVSGGINVNSSDIANGLINNGTISSTIGVGILISDSSTLTGGILNSGMISTQTTSVTIDNSTLTGDIYNSGIIDSHAATGVRITGDTTIYGSIFNSGTINGAGVDSAISIIANSAVNGNITNQGFLNANNGNAIALVQSQIHGGISNIGRIVSNSGNGIYLGNESTVNGSISNSGFLNGGQNGISILSGSTVGEIANAGTISGDVFSGLSIRSSSVDGGISNTGTIRGGSTGINLFSATVDGGISNSGTIQGDIFAINIANSHNVIHIDIIGQQAHIIGSVQADGTDLNIMNGAIFTSEGSFAVNRFNVMQNAVFNMDHTVTAATAFNNSGTLAVNNSLQTIVGDYAQKTGGVFQTTVSNVNNYGQLFVSNTMDLSQSGNIDVQITDNTSLQSGEVLSNVVNGNTLVQPTSGFNITDNSFVWNFISELNNTNTGVNLTPVIAPAAYAVCEGSYCQGSADAIIGQVAAGNSAFSRYGTLSTASAFQTAASQATPELTNENIQIVQLITRAVVDVAPMWSNLRGRSAGDAMLYQPGKIWVKPYGGSMTQNKRTTVNGFDATAYGAVVGKDIELSDNWMVGGAFAAGGDNIKGKSILNGQSIHSSAYQGMLYGSKKLPKQFYVAGQGLVGYENNDTSRVIPLYASTAKGSFNSWFTNVRAEAGWSTYAFGPNLVFTPEIDASYLYVNQGHYKETGSPMALSVASNSNSSLVLGAYGNGAYHLATLKNQHDLTLTAYAGIAGDVINSQTQVTSTFVAAGGSFSTFGVQFNGAVFRSGVGLVLTSQTKPLIVELNYDLQSGNNAYSGIGAATIKYKL